MSAAGARASRGLNLWAIFFWFVEITFAVIGGTTEMWVYQQFMAGGQLSAMEAFARALVTQLAIVGFGAAGIKAIQTIGGWKGLLVAMLAHLFALFFAFVTFDLMLVSAITFRNREALGQSDAWAIPTPWGMIEGQYVTLLIIAGVPFFQWAMAVFGPVITQERKQLSAEEIRLKGEADLAQVRVNAQLMAARLGGVVEAGRLALGRPKPQIVDALPARSDDDNPGGNESDTHGVLTLLPGGKGKSPSARGPWNKQDLLAYVEQTYPGVSISDNEALSVVKTIGNGRMKGRAYVASITQVKAWAARTYGSTKAGDMKDEASA
jgi:hypothetical protein